jgi:hypothetical protein
MAKSLMTQSIVIEDTKNKLTDIWYDKELIQRDIASISLAEANFIYHLGRVNDLIDDLNSRPINQEVVLKTLTAQLFYNLIISYAWITLTGRTYRNMEAEIYKSLVIFIERHKDKYYAISRLLVTSDNKRYMADKEKRELLNQMSSYSVDN